MLVNETLAHQLCQLFSVSPILSAISASVGAR